jgi:16S rRNA (guanine527-N7)-methyltransferase
MQLLDIEFINPEQLLLNGCNELGLVIDAIVIKKLLAYVTLIQKWNRVYNLTTIEKTNDIIVRHILDSLAVATYIAHIEDESHILDLGSGAGLPGIPLSLIFPAKQFTLLDSNGKKTRFLNYAKIMLNLTNIEVTYSRVESFQPEKKFTLIITRAFSTINDILVKTQHLRSTKTRILAMKGQLPKKELDEINLPFLVYNLTVPFLHESRHLIIIKNCE